MIGRKTDNLNVDIGSGETWNSYVARLREFLSRIRWQSEGHRTWYTHKNPAGCWICELLDICDRLLDDSVSKGSSELDDEPEVKNYDEEYED